MKKIAGYTSVIMATLAMLFGVWQFRVIVILILLSVFLAAAVRPMIIQLGRYKIPAGAAQMIVYGLGIAFFIIPIILFGRELSAELINFSRDIRVEYGSLYALWGSGSEIQQMIVEQIPNPAASLRNLWEPRYLTTVMSLTQNLVALGGGFALVMVMSIYWSADQNHFERLWLSFLEPRRRKTARQVWRKAEEAIGSYISIQFIFLVIAFLTFGAGFFLIQVRYAGLLTLLATALLFIPLIGGGLAIAAAFLIGLLSSQNMAIGAALVATIIIVVLHFVVRRRLNPGDRPSQLLTLFFAATLVTFLGAVGLFLAPLFSVATTIALNETIRSRTSPRETNREEIEQLRERLTQLKKSFTEQETDDKIPAEIESIVSKLQQLVGKTENFLKMERSLEQ